MRSGWFNAEGSEESAEVGLPYRTGEGRGPQSVVCPGVSLQLVAPQ